MAMTRVRIEIEEQRAEDALTELEKIGYEDEGVKVKLLGGRLLLFGELPEDKLTKAEKVRGVIRIDSGLSLYE